jgi:hypothetical protein
MMSADDEASFMVREYNHHTKVEARINSIFLLDDPCRCFRTLMTLILEVLGIVSEDIDVSAAKASVSVSLQTHG